jgi:hypothetical protein
MILAPYIKFISVNAGIKSMKILHGKIMVVIILLTNNISLWGALYQKMYTPYFNKFTQASKFQLPKSPLSQHPEDQSENRNFLDIDSDSNNLTTSTTAYDLIYSPNAQRNQLQPDSAIIKKIKLLIADSPQTVDPSTTSLLLGDIAKPLSRDSNASKQLREEQSLTDSSKKSTSLTPVQQVTVGSIVNAQLSSTAQQNQTPNNQKDSPASIQKKAARLAQKRSKQEDIDLSETFMANEPKAQLQPSQQPTIIIPSKISAGNAATARKEPRTLRAFMQSIGDWFSTAFGLSKQKITTDLVRETVELKKDSTSFVNAPTDVQAAQKYSVWLPQFIQKMLNAS